MTIKKVSDRYDINFKIEKIGILGLLDLDIVGCPNLSTRDALNRSKKSINHEEYKIPPTLLTLLHAMPLVRPLLVRPLHDKMVLVVNNEVTEKKRRTAIATRLLNSNLSSSASPLSVNVHHIKIAITRLIIALIVIYNIVVLLL